MHTTLRTDIDILSLATELNKLRLYIFFLKGEIMAYFRKDMMQMLSSMNSVIHELDCLEIIKNTGKIGQNK